MDKFVAYILFSEKRQRIYIGYTSSLIQRYYSHNFPSKKGYTIRYRPWKVIFVEFYNSKTDAMRREKWLKSGVGRKFIYEHIL